MKQQDLIALAAIGAAAVFLLRKKTQQQKSPASNSDYYATIKGATWYPPAIDGNSGFWSEKEPGW